MRSIDGFALAALCVAAAGCGSAPPPTARDLEDANDLGRTVAAEGSNEQLVLREIGGLPSGSVRRIGGASVAAEPAYVAASGRTCRPLHISVSAQDTRHRLACKVGRGWFFVPDVFGGPPDGGKVCSTCAAP